MASTTYRVFKVRTGPLLPDPDIPGTRYHTVLFIETNEDKSGIRHHVTGDLVSGMVYDTGPAERPEDLDTFHNKESIGSVLRSTYPGAVDTVLKGLPPPHKQKAFNRETMRTEPVKPDGTFYAPDEERLPLFKCTEWVEQKAIPALREAGVLRDE